MTAALESLKLTEWSALPPLVQEANGVSRSLSLLPDLAVCAETRTVLPSCRQDLLEFEMCNSFGLHRLATPKTGRDSKLRLGPRKGPPMVRLAAC